MAKLLRVVPILLLIALCGLTPGAGAPAEAQTSTGEVHGTVTDPTGAAVPSAHLALTGAAGNVKAGTSGHDGVFHISGIEPGTYTLVVTAKGFADASIDGIEVQAGKTLQETVALQLPVDQQQVEVTSDAQGVSTSAEGNASRKYAPKTDVWMNPDCVLLTCRMF